MVGSQPHAEFDSSVYLTTAQASPAAANQRYGTQRGGGNAVLRGDHDRQRAEIRNDGCKRDRRNILGIKTQQRDVGRVIASGDAGWPRRSVGKPDRDFALIGQRLVGRHDQARFPDEARGPQAVRMHRDDRRLCSGDEFGKGGGERGKNGCVRVGHGGNSCCLIQSGSSECVRELA